MLADERHNAIIAQINQFGSVRVKDLSQMYNVTEDCIRKDLTYLENQGLLKKIYGGAVKTRVMTHDFQVSDRADKNIEAKRTIAKKALSLIKDGDTIFLDISTTNIELAKMLVSSNKHVTLVTNCIDVILAANVPDSNVKLIVLGGTTDELHGGFVGGITDAQLKQYQFDIAFIGVVGVDLELDRVSTYITEDGITKRTAIDCSSRSYMMLETRKLHEDGTFWYAQVSHFTGALMDKLPDQSTDKLIKNYPIEWL